MTSPFIHTAQSAQPPRRKFFSVNGRLGRVRYITYCLAAIITISLFMLLAGYALSNGATRAAYLIYNGASVALLYITLPIIFAVLTIRRTHDFNWRGWLAVLLLIPKANIVVWLIFCAIPGTKDENDYGARPEPDPSGMTVAAIVLPLVFISLFIATAKLSQNSNGDAPLPAKPVTSLKPYIQ